MARTLKTPLGKVRGLGSAKSGTQHFIMQRLTAVANLVVVPAFILIVVATIGLPHARAAALVAHPLASILLVGFVVSVTMHMRIGLQVIIEDYVQDEGPKLIWLIANTLFAAGVAIAGIYAVLRIGVAG